MLSFSTGLLRKKPVHLLDGLFCAGQIKSCPMVLLCSSYVADVLIMGFSGSELSAIVKK